MGSCPDTDIDLKSAIIEHLPYAFIFWFMFNVL